MRIICKMLVFLLILLTSAALGKGSSDPDLRIIDGKDAAEGQFPYQVSLKYKSLNSYKHMCGGSIISSRTILTSASCIYYIKAEHLKVFAGSVKLNGTGENFEVEKLIPHSSYNVKNLDNDIGLVILKEAIDFSKNKLIKMIKLDKNYVEGGKKATVSGWGFTEYPKGHVANNLQYAELETISHDDCSEIFPTTSSQLCTFTKVREGIYKGDGGDPLVFKGKQIGIASFVLMSNEYKGRPDVFTRISKHIDWVNENKV